MRYLGRLEHETDVSRLKLFLERKGIEIHVDGKMDTSCGHLEYQIWVLDEDQLAEAAIEFEKFLKEPSHPAYDVPITEEIAEEEILEEHVTPPKPKSSPFSILVIVFCACVFLMNMFQMVPLLDLGVESLGFTVTPLQGKMFIDESKALQAIFVPIEEYQNGKISKDMAYLQAREKIASFETSPRWSGYFSSFISRLTHQETVGSSAPKFTSLGEGEYWRLISPAFLHVNFLHILFNMLWVWVLSRPIEERIGIFKLLILNIVLAVITNLSQYLMTGPFFMGYSGVIMGLAGFTWIREKVAPWEGYPMSSTIALFLAIFVLGMTLVQIVTFLILVFTGVSYLFPMANTAHIMGAIVGVLLGRMKFFSQKVQL